MLGLLPRMLTVPGRFSLYPDTDLVLVCIDF